MKSSLISDPIATFDLTVVAQELRAEEPYLRKGQSARAIVHKADLRIVVIALQAGKVISEHHANATASIQTLSGHINLKVGDQDVDLLAGQILVLATGLNHDVSAKEDSVFLLTLGWSASR